MGPRQALRFLYAYAAVAAALATGSGAAYAQLGPASAPTSAPPSSPAPVAVANPPAAFPPPPSTRTFTANTRHSFAAVAATSVCSLKNVTINVTSVNDINKRLHYSPTTTVVLVLQQDISLSTQLVLDSRFSCTIIQSRLGRVCSFRPASDRTAGIFINGVNHLLLANVNIVMPINAISSPKPCPWEVFSGIETTYCPALAILNSTSVQVGRGSITGAVHLFSSTYSVLDSLTIASEDWAIIVGGTGTDGAPDFTPMNNVISNNIVKGYVTGISLAYGAVGVKVTTNYITDFTFAGVSLGRGSHNVGDAMHNTVSNNYIFIAPNFPVIKDATGIYFATHWINIGNVLSCNYVVGTIAHCLYIDFGSSGVTVAGMVCHGSSNGLKMNTGHSNNIKGMLIIENTAQAGYMSPQYLWNCNTDPGSYWDAQRILYWNTPAFQAQYPWLTNFCSTKSINGVTCNPPGGLNASTTGGCSGMPTRNYWQSATVAPISRSGPHYFSLSWAPNMPLLNTLAYQTYPAASIAAAEAQHGLAFVNSTAGDFGLKSTSRLLRAMPDFTSCPRSDVGPRQVFFPSYFTRFRAAH
eukprot:SM000221S06950  [mRNA]  locus=s221:107249:110264:- [translate_table: standard]